MSLPHPSAENDFLVDHVALLRSSYRALIGHDLLERLRLEDGTSAAHLPSIAETPSLDGQAQDDPRGTAFAAWLFHAPLAVLSHDTQADPIFVYGNQTALDLFELDWAALTRMPSRLTAEPAAREERARLLSEVSAKGFITDYRGVRISTSGRRFLIHDAVVWNLFDQQGQYRGQAAAFARWTAL
jgi:hypothetical protein